MREGETAMAAAHKSPESGEKNKIFISWSGSVTNQFAMGLKRVMEETVFPNLDVECFVSNVDIASGTDWWTSISSELRSCRLGILCISNENAYAPWIFYEAGGMASRGVPTTPLLVGCGKDSLDGSPLQGKQCVEFGIRAEFIKLVEDVNAYFGNLLPPSIARQMAERGYEELAGGLSAVINTLKNFRPYYQSYSEKTHDAGTILQHAQSDILISTAVGNKLLGKYGDLIEQKLKTGVRVRYMMLDIDRFHEMEEYLHGSGKKGAEIHSEVLDRLKAWKRSYPGLVEAKFFHGYMTASYIGIDVWRDTVQTFSVFQVMMYQYRTAARRSPIRYIFPQKDERAYDTTLDSVKNMWKNSEDIPL